MSGDENIEGESSRSSTFRLPDRLYVTSHTTTPEPPATGAHVVLSFDPATTQMLVSDATTLVGKGIMMKPGQSEAYELAQAIVKAIGISTPVAHLYALHASEPQGLTPARTPGKPAYQHWMGDKERRQLHACFAGSIIIENLIPSGKTTLLHGWFAPGVDPERVGAAYLTPTHVKDNIGWALRYVGISPIAHDPSDDFASWNDPDAIHHLVERCLESDHEYVETIALLENSEAYEAEKRRHEMRRIYADAREAFSRPRDAIKPVIVGSLISTAAKKVATAGALSSFREVNLMPSSWGVLPQSAKPIYAGIEFRIDAAKQQTQDILDYIKLGLEAKKLGMLLRGSNDTYWVVKNPELVLLHKQACGVNSDFGFAGTP